MYAEEFVVIFLGEVSEKLDRQKNEVYRKKLLKEWEIYKKKDMATKGKTAKKRATIIIEDEEEETPGEAACCPHILTTGKNSGKPCGVKKVLENGFCARHKDSGLSNKTRPDQIIKKHPFLKDYWWNPKNKVVFEKLKNEKTKRDEFVAIGTVNKITSGQSCRVLDFTDEDVEKFKKLGYTVDESRVEKRKEKEKALKEGNDDILVVESDNLDDIDLSLPETVTETPEEISKEVTRILLGDIDDVLLDVKENAGEGSSGEEEETKEEETREERGVGEWIGAVCETLQSWEISNESLALVESVVKINKMQRPNYKLIRQKINKIIATEEDSGVADEVFEDMRELSKRLAAL